MAIGQVTVASNGTFTALLVTAPGALPGSYAVTVLPTAGLQSMPSEAIYMLDHTAPLRQPEQPTDSETLPVPISVQPARDQRIYLPMVTGR